MQVAEAIELIKDIPLERNTPALWADLGCGTGIFTHAMAELLPRQSTIFAIDKSRQSIKQPANSGVTIAFIQANFEKEQLPVPALDGIMMANALHYVSDQASFIQQLHQYFAQEARFIIIEYDIRRATPWVPYPLDFQKLQRLFSDAGFDTITKLGERKSRYGQGNIYACYIE